MLHKYNAKNERSCENLLGCDEMEHTSDLVGRSTFAGRDSDQQLHDGVIDPGTPRLDHEDILLTHAGEDANARLTLEEALCQCKSAEDSLQNTGSWSSR